MTDRSDSILETAENAVNLAGDFAVLPGTSQVLKGRIGSGLLHAAVGVGGRWFLGPAGWVAWFGAAANSYAKTSTGYDLFSLIGGARDQNCLEEIVESLNEARRTQENERTRFQQQLIDTFGEGSSTAKPSSDKLKPA